MALKECYLCKKTLPLDQFESDKRRPDGHGQRCKACKKAKYTAKPKVQYYKVEYKGNLASGMLPKEKVHVTPEVTSLSTNQCHCGKYVRDHDAQMKCAETKCEGYKH